MIILLPIGGLSAAISHLGKDHVGESITHFIDENNMQLISILEGSQLRRLLQKCTVDGGLEPSIWARPVGSAWSDK